VPYGVNPRWLALEPKPIRGRVLFVGTAGLRKGIHYLAMATEKLICRGRNYEFRVAGNVTDQVRRQPICRHLNFIGRVPRDRIHQEFQQADVFVLPSLAEGSAEVTYEAAAAGVPVVTTRAAGSIVRDDIEGRIVQERDLDALADAVEQIVENRALRDQMAHAARERARDYTWEQYGERLVTALKHLANEGDASFDSLASTVRNH
jgi:glycosyltransferase involved in cell wall biosynthesis